MGVAFRDPLGNREAMPVRPSLVWVILAMVALAGGFMGRLMLDMIEQMTLMTGHVANMSRDVGTISGQMGEMSAHLASMDLNMEQMTESMAHMRQNLETMSSDMGRMGQTIQRGGESIQRWNPMEMMVPKGMIGQ